MKVKGWIGIIAATCLLCLVGCEKESGPDLSGKITLSSQLHGTGPYYLYGFSFEEGEMYRFPHHSDPKPDIIIEVYPAGVGDEQTILPGFNTPGQVNGFAMVGEFSTWDEAYEFYNNYDKVEDGLYYETASDVVELYQVWVQQTSAGNYVKMVVRDILQLESEIGDPYNEVSLEYTYAPDGSTEFS